MAASLGRSELLMGRMPSSHDYMPAAVVCWRPRVLAASARQRTLRLFRSGRAHCMRAPWSSTATFMRSIASSITAAISASAKADGQFDLPRAKEGGLGALFFSIFVTEDYYPARFETKQALRMLDCAIEQIGQNSADASKSPARRRISSAFTRAARSPRCWISKAASTWMATRP